MFNKMNAELAAVFAHYAERRDSRVAFLGRKADREGLTGAEMSEYIERLERLYEQFHAERVRLLEKKD